MEALKATACYHYELIRQTPKKQRSNQDSLLPRAVVGRLNRLHLLPTHNHRCCSRNKVAHTSPLCLRGIPPQVIRAALDEDISALAGPNLATVHLAFNGAFEHNT